VIIVLRYTGRNHDIKRAVLLDVMSGGQRRYGLELSRITGLRIGTLYCLLDELEEDNCIVGESEPRPDTGNKPADSEQPRRRFYRLTPKGQAEADSPRTAELLDRPTLTTHL
jgi:DNA-binding PadR family transcriptional regulator